MSSITSNTLQIVDNSRTLIGVTYIAGSAVVTSGESYDDSAAIGVSGNVWTITFSADRKGSSDVATSFNSASGGTAYEYAASGGGETPDELNFYFTLELAFSTAQGNAIVSLNTGQGHFALSNNWWLGGSIVTSNVPCLTVPITGTTNTLMLPLSGSTSSYTFGPGTIN
jgi:hypothetical protein